jgi:hypothetical protein
MRKKIILDTDVFADIGDIGAIAVACALHKLKVIELLAIVIDTNGVLELGGIVDQVCRQYGLVIPIGQYKGSPAVGPVVSPTDKDWFTPIYNDTASYPRQLNTTNVPNSLTVYQQILSANKNVHICAIGGLTTVNELLTNSPGLLSSVDSLHISAGNYNVQVGNTFTGAAEFNFANIDKASAANVCANWGKQINYIGASEFNDIWSGYDLLTVNSSSITRAYFNSYKDVNGFSGPSGVTFGRWIWDQAGLIALAYDYAGFAPSRYGKNEVNAGTGVNIFTPSASGIDRFWTKSISDTLWYSNIVDSLMLPMPNTTASTWQSYTQWTGSAWAVSPNKYSLINFN